MSQTQEINHILLVEDTPFFERVIRRQLNAIEGLRVVSAANRAEAVTLLEESKIAPVVALVDLILPDAPDGEIVDVTLAAGLPTIVFSGCFDEKLRTTLLDKGVVDYILKDNATSLVYVTSLVRRVCDNRKIDVLIVDDSPTDRQIIARRLSLYQLRVHTANTYQDALQKVDQITNLQLVVLDYVTPNLDGFDLLRALRGRYSMSELAVIGLSSRAEPGVVARFLKSGANDCLPKSCTPEEFMLRISQNLDTLYRIRTLDHFAHRDALTGLSNRRHLFSEGAALVRQVRRAGDPVRVAVMDIDRFKSINDSFGHEVGDELIRSFAQALDACRPDDAFAARLGGDEFCLILPRLDEAACCRVLEALRHQVAEIDHADGLLSEIAGITISIGLSNGQADSLQDALRAADIHLYAAKRDGRNRVVAS